MINSVLSCIFIYMLSVKGQQVRLASNYHSYMPGYMILLDLI